MDGQKRIKSVGFRFGSMSGGSGLRLQLQDVTAESWSETSLGKCVPGDPLPIRVEFDANACVVPSHGAPESSH
jgi:hypothetical protein